jgi:hypothetical protein
MDGAYKAFVKSYGTDVVEDFAAKHREECQIRLARIFNRSLPEYQNGKTIVTKLRNLRNSR